MSQTGGHRWRFVRVGGFDQVRLDTGADFANLHDLDQKLWAALTCPAKGLEFDTRTLALIDTDRDGRIRVPELLAAVRWTVARLKDPAELARAGAELPLSAINDGDDEGRRILASAKRILKDLGKPDAAGVTADDTSDTSRIFARMRFNGDGIVTEESADDDATRALLRDIMDCVGSEADRGGKPGVSEAKLADFFGQVGAHLAWRGTADADAANLLPLGDATAGAAGAAAAVQTKVDDYFMRCRLAAFDARAADPMNRAADEYAALAGRDLSVAQETMAALPLARVEADRALPLETGLNPAWAGAVAAFRAQAVRPILGDKSSLTAGEWSQILRRLAPFRAWQSAKAGAAVEKLGPARLREIAAGAGRKAVEDLIAKDKALEPEAQAIASVDRLVRHHRDLHRLLNNFVTFHDFYSRKAKAVFQAGTLYLDGRACDLCLRVDDPGKHAALAGLAKVCLAYCDCTRPATGEKMQIAAAFTAGDSDRLMVGRNGLFYDRQGRDWDATIVKIIENPISIRQAFFSPYKRFVRMIEEQAAKRAAAAEAASDARLASAAEATANVDKSKAAPAPKKIDVGTVAAMGVAVGAIGAAISALVTGVLRLPAWQVPLVFVGLMLVISGPSMAIAWLKLRQRNLGPILDANGWAVNARAKMNVPFGASLTSVGALPPGSERSLVDPFAEKRQPWGLWLALALAVAAVVLMAKAGHFAGCGAWFCGR